MTTSTGTKRVFISFAIEDEKYRNLLRGQARLGDCPIEYIDYSVKQPWDNAWKTQCRQRIKGCAGVIALVSSNTRNADGARWEMQCAIEEGVPILGVYVSQTETYTPPELAGKKVIRWTWEGIADFIKSL